MRLDELNELKNCDAVALAEEREGRLLDGRLLFNQKDTARLLDITPRAFADWPIEPEKQVGRQKFFYWPDVLQTRDRRLTARP